MAHHSHEPEVVVLPPDRAKIALLWKTAGILLAITILEFAFAFGIPHEYHNLRVAIFVAMTIVKAGYIVLEFMHLKYEVKVLFWAILIPMIFVVWMLVAFVYEGMKISEVNFLR
jgi:cytochrome c oxidase subunit IV